jgi:tetratricopeptide (TPR) repeat protein
MPLEWNSSARDMSNDKFLKKSIIKHPSMRYLALSLVLSCILLLYFSSSSDANASQSTGHVSTKYMPPGMYSRYSSHIQYLGAMIDHANVYVSHGKYYEAISSFDKVLKNDPSNFMALLGKGYALEKLEKYDEAISYLDKALKIYPNNAYAILFKEDSLYSKALTLVSLGKYGEATSYYEIILKMNPKFDLSTTDKSIIQKYSQ